MQLLLFAKIPSCQRSAVLYDGVAMREGILAAHGRKELADVRPQGTGLKIRPETQAGTG
jgi:hypothetical protein